MISLSSCRAIIAAHVINTTKVTEKLVQWTMLVSLANTTVEAKNGATVKETESSLVQ